MESAAEKTGPQGDGTMSFLLDTDICSAYLKGNRPIGTRFEQYNGRLSVSAIVASELFTWVMRAKASPAKLQGLMDFLNNVIFLDVNWEVSRKFGEIRAKQLDQGISTPEMDLMIASTAILHDLTLVTHNVKDYANVPDLKVIDWMNP
jgi:tRNA(fMet)-specific endonuclease VapC